MKAATKSIVSAENISADVRRALAEDLGTSGDLSAALLPSSSARARIEARQKGLLCGLPWATEVWRQLNPAVRTEWLLQDGQRLHAGQIIGHVCGPLAALLSGERCALNFLQLLSGTATTTARYQACLPEGKPLLLDTRKTIPGLRYGQRYAVRCGGGQNHRFGLFDTLLLKENHITALGGVHAALLAAKRHHPQKPLILEVETMEQVEIALQNPPQRILLDNFAIADLAAVVQLVAGRVDLEYSGNVTLDNITAIAQSGIDYLSVGALTKNLHALDLSLLLEAPHAV